MTVAGPLRPWSWCLIWLIVIWLGIYLLVLFGPNHKSQCYLNGEGVPSEIFESRNKPLVVAIGDSLLRYSTPREQWLGEGFSWLRLSVSSARWYDFVVLKPLLEKLKPRYILVQDSLFLEADNLPLKKIKRVIIGIFRKGGGKHCHYPATNFSIKQKQRDRVKHVEKLEHRYRNSLPIRDGAFEFLSELQSIGGEVIVIHFPREESWTPSVENGQWLPYLESELAPRGIELLTVGQPLPTSHYLDGAHVNRDGREIRLQKLRTILKERL